MGISIAGSTLTDYTVRRALEKSVGAVETTSLRLSSGLRINSAADDPGSMVKLGRVNSSLRAAQQDVRNANDGISLLQTAESSLAEIASILESMQNLAQASATDTVSNTDRENNQSQLRELADQINTVADATTFNTQDLLTGDYRFSVQVGAGSSGLVTKTLKKAVAGALGGAAVASGTATSTALTAGSVRINFVSVRATTALDDTTSVTGNTGSAIAKAAAINDSGVIGVTATAKNTTFTTSSAIAAESVDSGDIVINDVNIGAVTTLSQDSNNNLLHAINNVSANTGVTAARNSSGYLTLTATDGRNIKVKDITTGTFFNAGATTTTYGTVEITSNNDMYIDGSGVGALGLTAGAKSVSLANNLTNLDVGSVTNATTAMTTLSRAIDQISLRRGDVASLMERLESAAGVAGEQIINFSNAKSKIEDADLASELSQYTRSQVLAEVGKSVLAQANQSRNTTLALLDSSLPS